MKKPEQHPLQLEQADTEEGRLFNAYDKARRQGINNMTFQQAMQNEQVARVLRMAAEATR